MSRGAGSWHLIPSPRSGITKESRKNKSNRFPTKRACLSDFGDTKSLVCSYATPKTLPSPTSGANGARSRRPRDRFPNDTRPSLAPALRMGCPTRTSVTYLVRIPKDQTAVGKGPNPLRRGAQGLSAALGCQDSNLEPSDPESDVLPIAPQPIIMRKPFLDNNLRRLSLLHNCRGSALGKLPGQTRSSESVTCTVARAIIATDRKSGLYQKSHACFIHVYKPAVNRPHDGFWARRGRPEKRGAHPQGHHGQRTSPLASTHGRATAA